MEDLPPVYDEDPAQPAEEPPADMPTGPRALQPKDWEMVLDKVRMQAPIQVGMIGQTLFVSDDDGLLTVAIHPADTDSRDALLGGDVTALLCEAASALSGRPVNLRVVTDASLPAPVEEEPLPPPAILSAPPKRKAPEPEKKEEPAPASASAPSLKPTEDEFYKDPLIELALKEFHAKIIK